MLYPADQKEDTRYVDVGSFYKPGILSITTSKCQTIGQ